MRGLRFLKVTAFLLLISSPVFAGVNNIEEIDGVPSVYPWKIKVSNGTLTDNGDGSATLAIGGGTPGGSNTQVQFNDSGAFGGDAGLVYNKVSDTLFVPIISSDTSLTLNSAQGQSLTINSGNSLGAGVPDIAINAGNGGSGAGGAFNIQAGAGGTNSSGGAFSITAGAGDGIGTGGPVNITSGAGGDTANGGDVTITGGAGGATSGNAGNVVINGGSVVGGVNDGDISLGTTGNGDITLSPGGNLSINSAYTLPKVDGTGNYVLTTNGAGVASWQPGGSGSPGTPTNSIQFNDSSSFAGDKSFIWDKTLNRLSISRDAAQGGEAILISSDTGALLANISHDGAAMFQRLSLQATPLSSGEGGTGVRTSGNANALVYYPTATTMGTLTADTTAGHVLVSTATLPNFRQLLTSDTIGTLPVARGGTGITSGTSGGVPYFINSGLMASSLAFAANALVIGGGAGVAPATITADTTAGHTLFSSATSPAFRQALTRDSIGTMPVARGGTGITTGTANALPYFVNAGLMGSLTADTVVTHALMATSTSPAFRQILTTDIVGTFPPTPATPGGSTTQIQYNNASAFAGAVGLTTDGVKLAIGTGTSRTISLDVAGSFRTVPFQLTDGASIALDASRSNQYLIILGGNRTLANFTNATVGQRIVICVSQDATGNRKLGFGTAYKFGTDVVSYDSSTTAGTKDYIGIIFGNANSADIVSVSKGYR